MVNTSNGQHKIEVTAKLKKSIEEERESILKVFDESVSRDNVRAYLSPDMYEFIKDQSRPIEFGTISRKCLEEKLNKRKCKKKTGNFEYYR